MSRFTARTDLSEFTDCKPEILRDPPRVETALREAFTGEDFLSFFIFAQDEGVRFHFMTPLRQVTGFTSPSRKFAAVDLLSFADEKDRNKVFSKLRSAFGAKSFMVMDVLRANPARRPAVPEESKNP